MTNQEFITSFSNRWGTHPIAWMIIFIILGIIIFAIDFLLAESKNMATKIRTPLLGGALLLTAATAISAEMSFATASEATSARQPSLSAVADHYGLEQDPVLSSDQEAQTGTAQTVWIDSQGQKYTGCAVTTRKIDSYRYGHELSCLKVQDGANATFPHQG